MQQGSFTRTRSRVQISGIERFMSRAKVEEVDATITIREVVEAAVAIKEDEAAVVIK